MMNWRRSHAEGSTEDTDAVQHSVAVTNKDKVRQGKPTKSEEKR